MTARANPFRAQCVDALKFQPQNATWQEIMARLETLNFRAAIIGPHGRGKTTLLENLVPLLQTRGWSTHCLQLNSSKRNFSTCRWREISTLGARDVILLDGAEQLARWRWKIFQSKTRRAGGLIITSHRAGLLPTLLECESSSQLLSNLIEELAPQLESELDARVLFTRHDGNIRNALRELYDFWGAKK